MYQSQADRLGVPNIKKEFPSDKLTIVDVKAVDQNGATCQVEVQVHIHTSLRARMLYLWCDLYAAQLEEGNEFKRLKPVISIWVLRGTLLHEDERFHHHSRMRDEETGVLLDE